MSPRPYPTDVTDRQWEILTPLLVPSGPRRPGRPPTVDLRAILNGVLYTLRTGCGWRHLPHDFPPPGTVYYYVRSWRRTGKLEGVHTALREAVRRQAGREATPSAGIIDSQSVKTTERGGPRGYDAGKKITGRKRHIIVDTMGLLLAIVVHEASVQDRVGARLVLGLLVDRLPRLRLIWADGGYTGELVGWAQQTGNWRLEIVKRNELHTFKILPRRWVVERTFGWLGRYRRLSKDYETLPASSAAYVHLAMINLMSRRLAKAA